MSTPATDRLLVALLDPPRCARPWTRVGRPNRHARSALWRRRFWISSPRWVRKPAWNELVVYEMHIGTFNDQRPGDPAPGNLDAAIARLGHTTELGANAVQVMPLAVFPGDRSWGYNPSHLFAVESGYGGPTSFKAFVQAAHALGLAVIVDVVYNHLGPGDLDLWRFDGWHASTRCAAP